MRPTAPTVSTPSLLLIGFASRVFASSRFVHRVVVIGGLAAAMTLAAARAEAEDEPDTSQPDQLEEIYRRVALQPFFQRRIQSILQDEWQQAQENAQKVGLRRMSRRHFRRSLIALDRSTDAQIRRLIGGKKFAAWKRVRADYARTSGGDRLAAGARPRHRRGSLRLDPHPRAPLLRARGTRSTPPLRRRRGHHGAGSLSYRRSCTGPSSPAGNGSQPEASKGRYCKSTKSMS
jgi:hypothetical protein